MDLADLGTGGFRIDGDTAQGAGTSVAGAGDVNGDGLADVIVGAPLRSPFAMPRPGSAYVVFGKATTAAVELADLGAGGFRIQGADDDDLAGLVVAGAGDVNGDRLADVIVGAPTPTNSSDPNRSVGAAYVVFGKASSSGVNLGNLGAGGFRIVSGQGGERVGTSVAGAGDVDGDRRADVIVGTTYADGRTGVYVVFGKADTNLVGLCDIKFGHCMTILGAAAGDGAGTSVSGAGDVNGDGFADVIVGAPNSSNGRALSGSAYVVFGKSDHATVDLAHLGFAGYRIDGAAAGDGAGSSVAGAGDVNGDGRADVLIGAPAAGDNGRDGSGSAYVVFGKEISAPIPLGALGAGGFRVDGEAAGDGAGQSLAGVGDVTGDGRPDILIGAPRADHNGRLDSGSTYLVPASSLSYAAGIAGTVGRVIAPAHPSVLQVGAAVFTVSPPLPEGLRLDATTGVVSGVPVATEEPTTHTVTMTDAWGTASAALPVSVSPADRDRDGVVDALDNCPDVANSDQRDADHDGLGDACDPFRDVDRDGYGPPQDCDDENAAIHPGAVDIPGDKIDEDCSHGDARPPRIASNIHATFRGGPGYVVFRTLAVSPGVAGSTIRITCHGPGCPRRTWTRKVTRASANVNLIKLMRRVRLHRHTTVEIRVTAREVIGVGARWHGLGPSRTDLCFSSPTSKRPRKCPG